MEATQPTYFRPGEYLFHENEPAHSMFIIQKGSVSIRKRAMDGNFVELGVIHSGEVLGELSFFDRSPRSASAVAITEVEATQLDFTALDKVYANIPPYLKTIIAACAERLRRANDLIRRLQRETIGEKGGVINTAETPTEDAASVLAATSGIAVPPSGKGKT